MALSEVRVPPFYRGNWQGDNKTKSHLTGTLMFLRVDTSGKRYPSTLMVENPQKPEPLKIHG